MLVSQYTGRLPGPFKRLTWLLFGAYVLQADILIFMRASAPVLAALHPVLALVDFALGLTVARRALRLVRAPASEEQAQASQQGEMGTVRR